MKKYIVMLIGVFGAFLMANGLTHLYYAYYAISIHQVGWTGRLIDSPNALPEYYIALTLCSIGLLLLIAHMYYKGAFKPKTT